MSFYSKYIDLLHVKKKPLYDILQNNSKFHWKKELETLFQQIKTSVTKDFFVAVPNTNHPF